MPRGKKGTSPLRDKPLRNPGQALDEKIETLIHDRFLSYFVGALAIWLAAALEWLSKIQGAPRRPGLYASMALVVTIVAAVQFFRVRRQVGLLKQGRDGERLVGQQLEKLRENGAQIFHDVPGDGFNLDHVVISSKGVLVVETKTWSKPGKDHKISANDGALFKNGQQVDPNPIRQVVAEYQWLARILLESTGKHFPVFGAVVFPGWFVSPVDAPTKKLAWVLEPKALPAFIQHEPQRLDDSDVKLACFHLSRYIQASRLAKFGLRQQSRCAAAIAARLRSRRRHSVAMSITKRYFTSLRKIRS